MSVTEFSWLSELKLQIAVQLLVIAAILRRGWRLVRGDAPRITSLALVLTAAVAVTLSACFAWADHHLGGTNRTDVPRDSYKVWSTRRLVVGGSADVWDGTQNSIESVRRAFEHGARGVEIDVFFDPDLGTFVVSHDRPYLLKNGRLLMLEELLGEVGHLGMFWLDWKKLRHLAAEDFVRALDELTRLTSAGDLRARFYVEGEDPFRLRRAAEAGFLTILDSHPLPDSAFLAPLVTALYKSLFYFGGHTVLALESGDVDDPVHGPRSERILRNVPLFVYHVPDDAGMMRQLALQENVRVILPRDQTLDRFGYAPEPGPDADSG